MKLVDVKLPASRTIKQSALLISNLIFGIVWFTWVVASLALGAGLAITLFGIPLLALAVRSGRVIGAVDRGRLHVFTDTVIEPPARKTMPSGVLPWLRTALGDKSGWKGLAYGVVMLPWGLTTFVLVVLLWVFGLAAFTAPLYDWALPSGTTDFGSFALTGWGRIGVIAAYVVLGALVLLAIPHVVDFLARTQIALSHSLLSLGSTELLERKVDDLQQSRSASISTGEDERRRIERDLHDGTQQRLTGIAIDLGIARERLSAVGDEQSRELIDRAQEGLKEAIAELRDLVRGIHPAILADRGLDAAISVLAARTSIEVNINSDLERRLSAAVESTAYFIVAEAMTNVMKHSQAALMTVTIRDKGENLEMDIVDNGRGGASLRSGGGLEGLQTRLRGVGGTLEIDSPAGGPTHVRATIPCVL